MQTAESDKLLQAESLLRLLERMAFIGVWTLDVGSGELEWSGELAVIHDAQPGFQPPSDDPFGFYAPEWREKIAAFVDQCASSGAAFDEEMQIITVKGRRAWVRTLGHAVRDDAGDIVRI